VSAVAGRLALRTGGVMLRPLLLLGCVGLSGWMAFAGWHVHRAVAPVAEAPRERTLRVLHWNQASRPEITGAGGVVRSQDVDIAVVVNVRNGADRREVVEAMFELAPPGEGAVRVLPNIVDQRAPGHIFGAWQVIIGSREKILRAGIVPLSKVDGTDEAWGTSGDAGVVVWCEIEPGERFPGLDRPLVVWAVDLPSDPSLWRQRVMANAASVVAAWEKPAQEVTESGWWRPVGDPVRVPTPDIVIGDFNTPRGSASLDALAPGMEDAFEQAGWGRAASWRQARAAGPGGPLFGRAAAKMTRLLMPLADWHIDLTLVGERLRATRYRLVDPGGGPHRVQVVDLVER
jgi:hypothetical protein